MKPIERPFPQQKPCPALLEEDRFMEDYGGAGCRCLYRLICLTTVPRWLAGQAVALLEKRAVNCRWRDQNQQAE